MATNDMKIEKPEPEVSIPFYKFFNFKKVSDQTGIHPDKIYNNLKGFYTSLSAADKSTISRLLRPQVVELFKVLGYTVTFKKISE